MEIHLKSLSDQKSQEPEAKKFAAPQALDGGTK